MLHILTIYYILYTGADFCYCCKQLSHTLGSGRHAFEFAVAKENKPTGFYAFEQISLIYELF